MTETQTKTESATSNRAGVLSLTMFEYQCMMADAQRLDNWARRQNRNRDRIMFWCRIVVAVTGALAIPLLFLFHHFGKQYRPAINATAVLGGIQLAAGFIFLSERFKRPQKVDAVQRLVDSTILTNRSDGGTN